MALSYKNGWFVISKDSQKYSDISYCSVLERGRLLIER